jgi:hypothetical protein
MGDRGRWIERRHSRWNSHQQRQVIELGAEAAVGTRHTGRQQRHFEA